MASDIKALLVDVVNAVKDSEKLEAALTKVAKAKAEIAKTGSFADFKDAEKLERATKKLAEAKKVLAANEDLLNKKREEGIAISEEEWRINTALTNDTVRSEARLVQAARAVEEQEQKVTTALKLKNDQIRQNFLNNNALGKTYSALTGTLAKVTAGLTVGGLAWKATTRFMDTARLRTDLIIQSYRGLDPASDSISSLGRNLQKVAVDTYNLDKAVTGARVSAAMLGMDAGIVNEQFLTFSKIIGSKNPEDLRRLTESSLVMARALNISVGEATEFVTTRMQKYGGSAESAMLALRDMRDASDELNTTFGRTIIRGEDLAKTVLSITKESEIFAIDQTYVSNKLQENIVRLQSLGESYDYAFKRAKMFMEASTTKQPTWIKILTGQTLVKDMTASMKKGGIAFTKEFGRELDKAKPGLSAKVADIVKSDRDAFSKSRLIQELVEGTSVGMEYAEKQRADFIKQSGGNLSVIMSQFNLSSFEEADQLVKMTEESVKNREELNKKIHDSTQQYQAELEDINAKILAMEDLKAKKSSDFSEKKLSDLKKQRDAEETLIAQTTEGIKDKEHALSLEKSMEADLARRKSEQIKREKELVDLEKTRDVLRGKLKEQPDKATEDVIRGRLAAVEKQAKKVREDIAEGKGELRPEKKSEAIELQQATNKYLDEFKAGSILSGDYLKAAKEGLSTLSSIAAILGGILAWNITSSFFSSALTNVGTTIAATLGGSLLSSVKSVVGIKDIGSAASAVKTAAVGAGGEGVKGMAAATGKSLLSGPVLKDVSAGIGKLANLAYVGYEAYEALPKIKEAFEKGGPVDAALEALPTIGKVTGSFLGGALGGVVGGAAGTLALPGVGTAVGGLTGRGTGAYGGAKAGDYLGTMLKDYLKPLAGIPATPVTTDAVVQMKTQKADAAQQANQQMLQQVKAATTPPTPQVRGSTTPGSANNSASLGTLNPNGSVTLTIPNFMDVFASATAMSK